MEESSIVRQLENHLDDMDKEGRVFFDDKEENLDSFLTEWKPSRNSGDVRSE